MGLIDLIEKIKDQLNQMDKKLITVDVVKDIVRLYQLEHEKVINQLIDNKVDIHHKICKNTKFLVDN